MSDPKLGPSPAQITIMGHNITARVGALRLRRRRRARLAVAGGALLVGAALTAAGFAVATAPSAQQAGTYWCFSADDPRGEHMSVPLLDDSASPSGAARVAAALESCELAYGIGGVTAPQPTACELPDLRLAVFPNREEVDDVEQFCTSLGLGVPPE